MFSKDRCNCLKRLRKNVAELNGVEFEPMECDVEVCNCSSCSLCDQETEQLLAALRNKEASGSPIRIDVESIEAFGLLAVEPFDYDGPMPIPGVPSQDDMSLDNDFQSIGQIHPITPDNGMDK